MSRGQQYFPCPQPGGTPECPYFTRPSGCFEDTHHLYQTQEKMTRLMRIFRNLPENLIDTCRRLHTEEFDPFPLEYPIDEVMKETILEAEERGEVTLSRTKWRVVHGHEE